MGDNGSRGLLEMRQAGSRTVAQVEAADAAADRLRQTAELALAFSAAAGDETLNQVSRLERQALDGLGLMENVETRIRTALVVLGQAAPKVASLLKAAISDFSDRGAIAEALADVEMQLTEQGQDAVTSAMPGTELAETLTSIRRTYTMEGERRIHDGMWGRPEPTLVKTVTEDDDGLGLFDDTPAETSEETASRDDADVLFF